MAVRTARSPPQPHLPPPRGGRCGLVASGWRLGRMVVVWAMGMHSCTPPGRPRTAGPELVEDNERPPAATKMHLASARGYLRLLRRWQWPARWQCCQWGRQAWSAAANDQLRGEEQLSPGPGRNPRGGSPRAERAAVPGPMPCPGGGVWARRSRLTTMAESCEPTPM